MSNRRKRIAIEYKVNYNEATSIPIYVQNLLKAFNFLDDKLKPFIVLLYQEGSPIEDIKKINYPYISYLKEYKDRSIPQKIFHKLFKVFFRKTMWKRNYWHPFYPKVDLCFPNLYFDDHAYISKTIKWIVDMQQIIYPSFFSEQEIKQFNNSIKFSIDNNIELMFSSVDSYTTFQRAFPQASNKFTILPFASIISFLPVNEKIILEKFNLRGPYFIIPNQFWPHKNHITVLHAAKELLKSREDFEIVFTGKESSYRNTNISSELKKYVTENGLSNHIRFLGFVERNDLINLIKHSTAIIQPSLFEGWSTLVEEAKALNKLIILSNINIHIEQIKANCLFFESLDEMDLCNKMIKILDQKISATQINYKNNITEFLENIKHTFKLN